MAVPTPLRLHVVEAYERGDESIPAVAKRFGVGAASLTRWLRLKRETGSVERRQQSGGNARRITPEGERLLQAWVAENPRLPQHVLARNLALAGQPAVTQQTVGRALRRIRESEPTRPAASEDRSRPSP